MCRPKEEGGLGIKDVEKFNTTLLAKWKWRLGVKIGTMEGSTRIEVWIMEEPKSSHNK